MAETSINRRTLVVSGAAALAMFGLASKSGLAAPVVQSGGGISGGGSVLADESPAEFSVFGSRFVTDEGDTPIYVGQLSYYSAVAKTTIASLSIAAYGPIEGQESAMRQMSGIASVNGEGQHPFNVILTDGGPIGSGLDHFKLDVGADGATEVTDPILQVDSAVQAGNLALIDFDFGTSEASPTPAG